MGAGEAGGDCIAFYFNAYSYLSSSVVLLCVLLS